MSLAVGSASTGPWARRLEAFARMPPSRVILLVWTAPRVLDLAVDRSFNSPPHLEK